MAKETPPQEPRRNEPPPPADQYRLRPGCLLVPLTLIVLYVFLRSIAPVLSWNRVMDVLNVHDRQRYTMLALLCLSLILIAAIWRILRR